MLKSKSEIASQFEEPKRSKTQRLNKIDKRFHRKGGSNLLDLSQLAKRAGEKRR